MKAPSLATLRRGFDLPAQAAQLGFRCLLEAMARPGRVQLLPPAALAGLESPGIGTGLCALLLTLLDAETRLHVGPGLPRDQLLPYLRFHTGVRVVDAVDDAEFVCCAAEHAHAPLLQALCEGSDEAPQRGATLIVEAPVLAEALPQTRGLILRGPGIRDTQRLGVGGINAEFWRARAALEANFPRGIDLVFCCGDRIAALPRSTRIELEG